MVVRRPILPAESTGASVDNFSMAAAVLRAESPFNWPMLLRLVHVRLLCPP